MNEDHGYPDILKQFSDFHQECPFFAVCIFFPAQQLHKAPNADLHANDDKNKRRKKKLALSLVGCVSCDRLLEPVQQLTICATPSSGFPQCRLSMIFPCKQLLGSYRPCNCKLWQPTRQAICPGLEITASLCRYEYTWPREWVRRTCDWRLYDSRKHGYNNAGLGMVPVGRRTIGHPIQWWMEYLS